MNELRFLDSSCGILRYLDAIVARASWVHVWEMLLKRRAKVHEFLFDSMISGERLTYFAASC